MPAVQVGTSTAVLVPATNNAAETILIQNLGPNAIAVELGGAAVLATSWNIPATAVQVSPADTRYVIT
jgi:hypothetical protein